MAIATVGLVNRSRKAAMLGAAAVTATALAAGLTSPAVLPSAAALDLNAVTTGPLLKIAEIAGINTIEIPDVPVVGSITVDLTYAKNNPVTLADAINAYPLGGFNALGTSFKRQPGGLLGTAILAGSGPGAFNAGLAYEALLSSAEGNTLPGYTPMVASGLVNSVTGAPPPCTPSFLCVQGTNITNLAVVEVNNPGTPNGGLYARFKPLLDLFGQPSVSIGGTSASSTGLALNAAVVGIALGYNAWSDFPATLNPFSLTNTALATFLPTYLLGGATIEGASTDTITLNLGTLAGLNSTSTSYSTVVPNDLPLLEPMRLPVRVINAILGRLGSSFKFGTPLADALQPALTILVNTGYTDVQTPTGGGTYNRTYDQSGNLVTYLSQAPLTPAEWVQVPGDVVRALVVGFQDSFPILRFGKTAPILTVNGNHLAITYPPAATPSAAVAKAVVAAGSVVAAPAAESTVQTPLASSAPLGGNPAGSTVTVAAPRTGRGPAASAPVASVPAGSPALRSHTATSRQAGQGTDSPTRTGR